MRIAALTVAAALVLSAAWLPAGADRKVAKSQEIQMGDAGRSAAAKAGHVSLLSDAVTVSAGREQRVQLRFRVDPGFHINSHRPADELLIPTSLHLAEDSPVKVAEVRFPAGVPFRLQAGEVLDVYQGEFLVELRVGTMPRGESTLDGTLRYQACNNAACFPARNLPVHVAVAAK